DEERFVYASEDDQEASKLYEHSLPCTCNCSPEIIARTPSTSPPPGPPNEEYVT
ncbi:MAG: hypothetical protein Q9164_007561, partial [Protoblastenia rupestris]